MVCKVCNKDEVKGLGMCGSCYAKDYRKKNKEAVKKYNKMRYVRDNEKIRKYSRQWQLDNLDKIASYHREYRKGRKEYESVARKTRFKFTHLKKECQDCGFKGALNFHHLKPLAVDNFKILCRPCHRKAHGTFVNLKSSHNNTEKSK